MGLVQAGVFFLWGVVASNAQAATPDVKDESSLTLEQAKSAALTNNPALRVAEAEAEEARGRLVTAQTYPYNPELDLEGADRDGAGGSTTDRLVELSQQIEIGGQKGRREAAGEAGYAAAARRLERRRQEVIADVERTFALALGARDLMEISEADVALTKNLLEFERKRLEAGAISQIQLNVAQATAGRSVRRFQKTRADWSAARSRLAEVAGLDPAKPPIPAGSLPEPPLEIAALESLLAAALARRPDLESLKQEAERAMQQMELERAVATPDLRLGVFDAREEGDTITGVKFGIAIPVFNRNKGGIVQAHAAMDRVGADIRRAELALLREVTEARARLEGAVAAWGALSELVVGTLEDSLNLLRRSMDAGKVNATDVLVLRRELVEGEREYVEATVDAWVARVELELATGGAIPPPSGGEQR